MATLTCLICLGFLVDTASSIAISAISKCQEGKETLAGDLKVFTVQVCNLFGDTCYVNQVEETACATKALKVDNEKCALFPIMSYQDNDRTDAAKLQVGGLGCSVSCSGTDCKFSGGCVSVQCKTGDSTFVGLAMTGTGSARTTGVTDTSVAGNFEVHDFAAMPTAAKQIKTVFLTRTGNYVATSGREGGASGTNNYKYGNLPTSNGNNYGPKACPTANTLSSATTLTKDELRMCGSTGKWVYYNGINLLMDKTMYVKASGDSASGASSTIDFNIGASPFLFGKSNYKSGQKMDDARSLYLYNAATATGTPLMNSEIITPAKSTGMATPTPDIAGTWRSYGVVFYCSDYARADLTTCAEASRKMFYMADPNPLAQFGTTSATIGCCGSMPGPPEDAAEQCKEGSYSEPLCKEAGKCRGDCCENGLIIPFGGYKELRWLNVVLVLLFLFYCFMGVAIIADIFMEAIEKVTSKKIRKINKDTGKLMTVTLWNPTVANLTLMALGSSAPEILLNVIGIFADKFTVEALGPATVVGSAAFNLLMIIAVCVSAISGGDVRAIAEVPVYVCTAIFSIFAYVWMLIIIGDTVVEVYEGVLTFLFFPILVFLSYLLDIKAFSSNKPEKKYLLDALSEDEMAELDAEIRKKHGKDLDPEKIAKIAQIEYGAKPSRATLRIAAGRKMFGGRQVQVESFARSKTSRMKSFAGKNPDVKVHPIDNDAPLTKPVVEFAFPSYVALESVGKVKLTVVRAGPDDCVVKVQYKTRDGAATQGKDYIHTEGTLTFEKGEHEAFIEVCIVDDVGFEEDEEFYVDLFNATTPDGGSGADIGRDGQAMVTVIDDDEPGTLTFGKDEEHVVQGVEDHELEIEVQRVEGCSGDIKVKYHTEDASAVEGRDYHKAEGELEMGNGAKTGKIKVTIIGKGRVEGSEMFRLFLEDASPGVKFDPKTDGREEKNILTIHIDPDESVKDHLKSLNKAFKVNWDKVHVSHSNWKDQFKDAIIPSPGDDGEAMGASDYVMHVLNAPWKLIFAICPPPELGGGWPCFVTALVLIGAVTVLIGDTAEELGCRMGIPSLITGITFVALGTSLPDTFASQTAAVNDDTADAAIVNVTGSNSVNVFLGIGLPWMIATFYHASNGTKLEVNDPNLAFNVIIFSGCAAVCLAVLALRRQVFGGELGGPLIPKILTSVVLTLCWLFYVLMTILKVEKVL